jgi:hypothetical protein
VKFSSTVNFSLCFSHVSWAHALPTLGTRDPLITQYTSKDAIPFKEVRFGGFISVCFVERVQPTKPLSLGPLGKDFQLQRFPVYLGTRVFFVFYISKL